MKKTEEQLAQELDAFLTARLQGRPLPDAANVAAEANVADELLRLAAEAEPDPVFLTNLEAQLAAASRQSQLKTRPERVSFWQNFITTVKEEFIMKRTAFAFATLVALFIVGYFAWNTWQGGATTEPEMIAGADISAEETAETPNVENLPALPGLSGATGLGMGMGGGGGIASSDLTSESPLPEGSDIRLWNPLAESEYILNTTLPTEPGAAPAYEQPMNNLFTLEDVSRFAQIFGFSGPIYTEIYATAAEGDVAPEDSWTPPTVYLMFDGSRQLSVADTHVFYYDEGAAPPPAEQPMALAQSGPIAESFLKERGLLDFAYEMHSLSGYDVEFRRVVDGRVVVFPEIQVTVNAAGQVWMVSYTPLSRTSPLGEYPLNSAEAAWQQLLNEGVNFQQTFFNIYPAADSVPPSYPASEEPYRFWERSYEDGDTIVMYPYPTVLRPVSGDAAPRIRVERYLLEGPAEQLQAMAEYAGRQIYLTGTIRATDAGPVVELGEWRPIEETYEYAYREGTIRREGEQALLVTAEGETIVIPDAPADLSDGERVSVSGWSVEPGDGAQPIFNWQSIGRIVEETVMPEPIEPLEVEPHQINQVTIEEVDLIYAVTTVFEEDNGNGRFLVQPVWRFKGNADTNETVEIFVQAVDNEFVSAPGQ